MKNIISDFWSSIRKSPFLFLFLFVQIIITSVVLYSTLANYYWTREQNNVAQISWGDNEYLRITPGSLNIGKTFSFFLRPYIIMYGNSQGMSSQASPYDSLLDESFMKELLGRVDRFHKEASAIDDLTILTALNSHDIYLTEPKEWLEEDRNNGQYYLFADEAYRGVHTLYINSEYLEFFQVKLSEGAYFEKNDFLYEKDYVPVLLGENLRKYYSIGEEFEGQDYPCPKTRYKVVGFIAPNQYFTCPNSPSDVYTYDNYIVAPVIERELKDFF